MAVEEDRVPQGVRDEHGEEAGDEVADDHFLSEHHQVRHGVAGGVGPGGWRAQPASERNRLPACWVMHLVGTRRPQAPLGQVLSGAFDDERPEEEPRDHGQQPNHDDAADVLAQRKLPANQDPEDETEFDHEVGRCEHEDHRRREVRAFLEE